MDSITLAAIAVVGVTLTLATLCWLILTHMTSQLLRVNDSHLGTTRELATANRALAELTLARAYGAANRPDGTAHVGQEHTQPTESSLTLANGSAREWQ